MSGAVTRCYKVLGPHRMPWYGGQGQWPAPGVWRAVEGPLVLCENALHYCTGEEQLLGWLGPEIWAFEPSGAVECRDGKYGTTRGRLLWRYQTWDETTARLFAADCAEHVLYVFEAAYPDDPRPRQAIAAARRMTRGGRSAEAAAHAAYDAANAAAYAAACDAVCDASYAATYAAGAATHAVGAAAHAAGAQAAARAAARAAAYAAPWAATAGDIERRWQAARLRAYLDGEVTA